MYMVCVVFKLLTYFLYWASIDRVLSG